MKDIVVVGSLNTDLVARVARSPHLGETVIGSDFHRYTGGKGANQAVAAAVLGGRVHLIACHGTDGFETELLATLRDKGVSTAGITSYGGASGIAIVLVNEAGGNSIVVIPGANASLKPQDIEANRSVIEEAGVVLTQLETPISCLAKLLTISRAAGVPVMLDPSPVEPLGVDLMREIEWLTPNEVEAAELTQEAVPNDSRISEFAERLLRLGPRNVLLKLGARGAYLATGSGIREHIPAPHVIAVDSTAAGDGLNGAFAVALNSGADPVEAARFGVAAATLSVTRVRSGPIAPYFARGSGISSRNINLIELLVLASEPRDPSMACC